MYVAIHQQAYQDLVHLSEPVPKNKKLGIFYKLLQIHNAVTSS
jgi:hypothetical protein